MIGRRILGLCVLRSQAGGVPYRPHPQLVRSRAHDCSRCDPGDTKVGVTVVRSTSAAPTDGRDSPPWSQVFATLVGTTSATLPPGCRRAGTSGGVANGMTFTRVRALIFVAVLFVTAGVVVLTAINRDTQILPPADKCAPGDIRANIYVPERRPGHDQRLQRHQPGRPRRADRRRVQEPRLQRRQDGDRPRGQALRRASP